LIDQSGLPEPEDSFYRDAQFSSNISSRGRSTSYIDSNTRRSPTALVSHSSSISPQRFRHISRVDPPYSPPATLISRQPYDDPDNFPHPTPIEEEDDNSIDIQADDEGDGGEFGHNDSVSSRSATPAQYAAVSRVQLSDRSNPTSSTSSHFSVASRAELLRQHREIDPNACTSCGSPPVPSFVALIPCDHLLCHQCINTLINSAAHKPPRSMDCFACGVLVKSFGPAFAGSVGMVDALRATLSELNANSDGSQYTQSMRAGGKENYSSSSTAGDGESSMSIASGYRSTSSIVNCPTSRQHSSLTPKPGKIGSLFSRLQNEERNNDSGVGTPDALGLSPLRKLDWSKEPNVTPQGCMKHLNHSDE
jgi:hypothetical protein